MTSRAVIGAGYGDEGKGHLVDYLCWEYGARFVVRYCGGAQAGHTVQDGDFRHVFHHFGSGTRAGVPTYLGPHFISNPIVFQSERRSLLKKSFSESEDALRLTADPAGRVTTWVDMLINEIAETWRGSMRHGSCGMGINETVERDLQHPINFMTLSDEALLKKRLDEIVEEWYPHRLRSLGIDPRFDAQRAEWIRSERVRESWIESARMMSSLTTLRVPEFLGEYDVVYEGSQGLLLSEDYTEFAPHLTRAKTGSEWISDLAEMGAPYPDDVVYVTRCYATRHGEGPFPKEVRGLKFDDPTNQPNEWQGSIRFGMVDVDRVATATKRDVQHLPSSDHHLAVTCLDQRHWSFDEAAELASELDFGGPAFTSHGPDRANWDADYE